jgi:hypothetical protein
MRLSASALLVLASAVCVVPPLASAEPILFGTPHNVSELNTAYEDRNAAFSADGLEVFFVSDRPGSVNDDFDIWHASRDARSDPFATPVNLSVVNSPGREATPFLSSDGLTLYFARGWTRHTQSYDVYTATRADRWSLFSEPVELVTVNAAGSDGGAVLAADGLSLYLVHNAFEPPPREDLYVSSRGTAGQPFGAPVRIDELSTDDMERDPWVSADGLSLYFVSNRGGAHFGDYDIFLSQRVSADDAWGSPVRISGIHTTEHEGSPFFDASAGLLYFHSNGLRGEGGMDIWAAAPVPEPVSVIFIGGAFAGVVAWRRRTRRERSD